MSKNLDKGLKSLLDDLPANTKIQKVTPIPNSRVEEEISFSFWLPKKKLKKLKSLAVEKEISIKKMINQALDHYFEQL